MKTIRHLHKLTLIGISALMFALALGQSGFAQENKSRLVERIGVYDSRAIAVAFAGSPIHEKQMKELVAEHKKAKAAGETDKVAKLEAEGKARQQKAHTQAFSTAPVDDILLTITNALPVIQKTANVSALVSKWNAAELKKHPGAKQVDVTTPLIDALQPNERSRKWAIDIQKQKPISLEQAEKIKD